MNRFLFGVVAGLIFGILDVLLMIPLEMEDKTTALMGAFFSRFAIGFLIPLVKAPTPGWVTGTVVGLLVSMPDAIITKAYAPILGVGVLGGALIGWVSAKWAASHADRANDRR